MDRHGLRTTYAGKFECERVARGGTECFSNWNADVLQAIASRSCAAANLGLDRLERTQRRPFLLNDSLLIVSKNLGVFRIMCEWNGLMIMTVADLR